MDDKVRAKMLEAFYLTQTTITDDPIERAIALIHAVRAMCDEQDFVDRRPAPTKQPAFEEARENCEIYDNIVKELKELEDRTQDAIDRRYDLVDQMDDTELIDRILKCDLCTLVLVSANQSWRKLLDRVEDPDDHENPFDVKVDVAFDCIKAELVRAYSHKELVLLLHRVIDANA